MTKNFKAKDRREIKNNAVDADFSEKHVLKVIIEIDDEEQIETWRAVGLIDFAEFFLPNRLETTPDSVTFIEKEGSKIIFNERWKS